MKHVVVVVPIDTKVDEAQNVAQEYRDQWHQSLDAFAVGHLHLQHHDGDDDGDHAITERFKPILSHAESTRAQRNFHFTNMATADGNKRINRKIGSSSRNEYPACDTPIHMFAAASLTTTRRASAASPASRERPGPCSVRHWLHGRRRVELRELRNALEQNLVGARVAQEPAPQFAQP